jgi:hypothetical protein
MKTSGPVIGALLATAAATCVAGISGGGAPASIREDRVELLVVGPVEAVKADARTAIVMGQRIHVANVDGLAIGDTAAVFGNVLADGSILASAVQLRGPYVPGASTVYISGRVQTAEPSIGRVVINGVAVDLTPMMSQGTLTPSVGTKLQVIGIQPLSGGLLIVNGISGGGAAVSGISGGGAAVSGISGGGAAVSGISGGGAAVSGLRARLSGISGGGAAVSGISGGGAAVSGISGGGAAVSGISGGGAAVRGISGGGAAVSGISGGGAAVSGISGGGAAVSGFRARLSGISGGGAPAGETRPR